MRNELTRDRLRELMKEIVRTAPQEGAPHKVYLVGGGTAVWAGWRESSVDADLFVEDDSVLQDVQGMKERLNLNIELARPEHFVPPLAGADGRHVFIEELGGVRFYHYDPYSQLYSKVVRGFSRDLEDARHFLESGMVEAERFRGLTHKVPDSAFESYPRLSPGAVRAAVDAFLEDAGSP